jgi:ATP-dependent exoDNAse (exonuclease V) alpha subunit
MCYIHTFEFLFNGEIFDIVKTEDGHCFTCLNGWNDDKELFTCQILTVKKINIDKEYKIIHIPEKQIIQKKKQLKKTLPNLIYLTIVRFFNQVYPKLTYGYSITIYKSQGSEWDTVFINLNSIKYSIVNSTSTAPTLEQKKTLFKSTYTAISRAKSDVWVVGF